MGTRTRIRIATWRLRLSRLLPEARPRADHDWAVWPWVALVVALVLPWITAPTLIPDSAEMLATGRCMMGLSASEAMCSGLDMGRYPVLFPLLAGGGWALGLSPMHAAIGLALLAAALCCAVGTHALERTHRLAALLLPALVLATPGLRAHLLTGDARGLMLLGLLGAMGWLTSAHRPGWQLGLWLSVALLARPDALVAAAGFVLLCAVWRRRALTQALPILAIAWAAQHMLQLAGGGPRGWEMKLARLIKVVPDDWIFQMVGLGMEETAFRAQVIAADLPSPPSSTGAWEWLIFALPVVVPVWLIAGAVAGIAVLIRGKQWRLLWGLGALASPSAVVFVAAQAREQVLPAANLLPVLLCAAVLMAVALGAGLRWAGPLIGITTSSQPGIPVAVGVGLCAILGTQSDYVQMDKPMEVGPAHAAAHDWLQQHTAPQDAVAVSFRTGGIPLLADRKRVPLPASWEVPAWLGRSDRPGHFIVSSIDSPGTHATLRELEARIETQPLVRFEDDTSVIWIYGLGGA